MERKQFFRGIGRGVIGATGLFLAFNVYRKDSAPEVVKAASLSAAATSVSASVKTEPSPSRAPSSILAPPPLPKADATGSGYLAKANLDHVPHSHRLAEYARFENLARSPLPRDVPEFMGWSSLPDLAYVEGNAGAPDQGSLSFRGLHFNATDATSGPNPSSVTAFRGPIAVIFPETKQIAVISGRLSVIHRNEVDRAQFAVDHNLKLDAAPENSRAAAYLADSGQSLVDLRSELAADSARVQQVEIEVLSGGVKK